MKKVIISLIIILCISQVDAQSYIFKGRQDTVSCTMLVSSLFASDGIKKIGDSTFYDFANVFTIKGFMVTPEHPSDPFYLDEDKKRIILLHVWLSIPYNYHVPSKEKQQ